MKISPQLTKNSFNNNLLQQMVVSSSTSTISASVPETLQDQASQPDVQTQLATQIPIEQTQALVLQPVPNAVSKAPAINEVPVTPLAQVPIQNDASQPVIIKQQPITDVFESQNPKKESSTSDKFLKYAGVAALVGIPVTAILMHRSNAKTTKNLSDQVATLTEQIKKSQVEMNTKVETETNKTATGVWKILAGLGGGMSIQQYLAKRKDENDGVLPEGAEEDYQNEMIGNTQKWIDGVNHNANGARNVANDAHNNANDARKTANDAKDKALDAKVTADHANLKAHTAINVATANRKSDVANPLLENHVENIYGYNLLKYPDYNKAGFNAEKHVLAMEEIYNSAPKYLSGEAQKDKPPLKVGDTLWSVTSEFAPIKEGGLGSVPVELQNNFESLGVKNPVIIPMYLKNGASSFRTNSRGESFYKYGRGIAAQEFKVEKAVTLSVPASRHGKLANERVEIFVSNSKSLYDGKVKKDIKPIIFVKNDNYFKGTIYSKNSNTEEIEKFAFLSKAVYELMKSKLDVSSVNNIKINNENVFNEIPTPDGLVLNDWQASPLAALVRYQSVMENACGELEDEDSKRISDMRIVTIGHNVQYQGESNSVGDTNKKVELTENILNTLFDVHAVDIVKKAYTKANNNELYHALIMAPEDMNKSHTNLLAMGAYLSDYVCPVSKKYSQEIVEDPNKSRYLQWAFEQRANNGTLVGVINGNDLSNISVSSTNVKNIMENRLSFTDFKTYNATTPLDKIMENRLTNKQNFIKEYLMADLYKEHSKYAYLGEMSKEELKETPVFSFTHRLVEQKGVDWVSYAIKKTFDEWDKNFPDKPKPIFYLGGQDGEGGKQCEILNNLQKELSAENSSRVLFYHGFAPAMGYMACSDFFLMPSKFEPCGLTQSESWAQGTPIVATATGGIVDTSNRNGKHNAILTDDLSGEGFYHAIKDACGVFLNDKAGYERMVKDSITEDFSWIQPNRQGPIYDYLELFGINRKDLAEKSELS
ncbi:MAG: glycogen/starch synthase [Candidatus Gastranaerophilales bacterium]